MRWGFEVLPEIPAPVMPSAAGQFQAGVDPMFADEYGTKDCSFYEEKCDISGDRSIYYCTAAPAVCRIQTPDNGWMRCSRACLQDLDEWYCDPPQGGSADGSCQVINHGVCWVQCSFNDRVPPDVQDVKDVQGSPPT